eukprot:3364005-Rhodomonas_salina.1
MLRVIHFTTRSAQSIFPVQDYVRRIDHDFKLFYRSQLVQPEDGLSCWEAFRKCCTPRFLTVIDRLTPAPMLSAQNIGSSATDSLHPHED